MTHNNILLLEAARRINNTMENELHNNSGYFPQFERELETGR